MSSSRDCGSVNPDSPSTNVRHPPPSLSLHRSIVSARGNELDITELRVPSESESQVMEPLQPPLFKLIIEQRRPASLTPAASGRLHIGFEGLTITAVAVITIQLHIVTSSSMVTSTITRPLLFFGMTSELLAILLAISFLQSQHYSDNLQRPPELFRLASGLPIVLLLTGIVILAVVLVVEMLKTSPNTAVAMSGFLILGVVLCLLASFIRAY